jgi:hypothetical protein
MSKKRLVVNGLVSNLSKTSAVGGMAEAQNLVSRAADKLESRHGTALVSKSASQIRKLFTYAARVIAAIGTNQIALVNLDGTVTAYSGSTFANKSTTDTLRTLQAGGSLLLLGSTGIYRLSAISETPIKAGGPRGLSFDRSAVTQLNGTGGFLSDGYQVAYRYTIAIKDSQDFIHEGEPSGRSIVANASFTSGWVTTVAKNVVIRMLLPSDATVNHFFKLFRSRAVPTGTQPDDDLQLVYQDYLTTKNIADGYVQVTDIYPETVVKGEFIHTAPNFVKAFGTVDGENALPPAASDGVVFKNRAFLFNIVGYHTYAFSIIAAPVGSSPTIYIGVRTFPFTTVTSGSATQNIIETALNLVELINKDASCLATAAYVSDPDGTPGKILLTGKSVGTTFDVTLRTNGGLVDRTMFDPIMKLIDDPNFELSRVGTTITANNSSYDHAYRVGEQVTVVPGSDFTAGPHTILTVATTSFTYSSAVGTGTWPTTVSMYGVAEPIFRAKPDNEQNAYCYSKIREFGAFPRRNREYVGERGVEIGRVIALKNSIIIWTFSGLYRLTGDSPETFRVEAIDPQAVLVGRETVVALGDTCIGWTSKGIIECSDGGWRILSDDITPTLERLRAVYGSDLLVNAFAVGHEADRLYEIWYERELPGSTALVLSLKTERWTTYYHPIDLVCGLYNRADSKSWYGDYSDQFSPISFCHKERRGLVDGTDFKDEIITDATLPTTALAAISKRAVWNPFAGKTEGAEKAWHEVIFEFDNVCPTLLQVQFTGTAAGVGSQSVTPADTNPIVRVWPEVEVQGARLVVGISASVISEAFVLIAAEVHYEEFGTESVR